MSYLRLSVAPLLAFLAILPQPGCSAGAGPSEAEDREGPAEGVGPSGSGGLGATTGGITVVGGPAAGGADPNGTPVVIVETLPDGFTTADAALPDTSKGGFQVVGPLADVAAPEGECANILRVIVRDFQASHTDFDNPGFWGSYNVVDPIGDTRKPEEASTNGTNGPDHLDEWYQNIDGLNQPFAVDLWLEPVDGTFVYDSTAFFPLAGVGYQDSYSFTTELHTNFEYKGGEVFTFRGDDDVFVFINGHLAVNLSGVHNAIEGSVNLDDQAAAFGLEVGGAYTFDLFQAERHPGGSNFRLETTLAFTGCGEILPVDVILR